MKYEIVKSKNILPSLLVESEPGDRWTGSTFAEGVQITTKHDRGVPVGVEVLKCGQVKLLDGKKITLMLSLADKPDLQAIIAEWQATIQAEKDAKEAAKVAEIASVTSGATPIVVSYHDGEYLSGFIAHGQGGNLLEKIGLAKHVDGWGRIVDAAVVVALGESFAYPDAVAYAQPALDAKAAKVLASKEALAAKFAEAKVSGKPALIASWMEDCNSPKENCSFDSMAKYAMPDGTTKTSRSHCY